MLVSHEYQFIYTKTVKTAGTSIELYFEPYCSDEPDWQARHHRSSHESERGIVGFRGANASQSRWFNHMSAAEIRAKLGQSTWDKYFKFCAVRNPYDLLVSLYWFELSGAKLPALDGRHPIEGFRDWLSSGIPVLGRAQSSIDGRFCLDYYIRFESLEADVAAVCRRLGLEAQGHPIPRYKSGIRDGSIALPEYYSKSLQAQVAQAYAPELEKFGYQAPL